MSWIYLTLLASAVSAVVSIFDKTIIYRYATTPKTLPLLIGFTQTSIGVVLLLTLEIPKEVELSAICGALISGALFGLGAQFLMRVLYTEEVSRAIPIFQSAPIFTAFFALFLLDENLALYEWMAILSVVLAAIILSLKFEPGGNNFVLNRSLFLLLTGSAIYGASYVLGKIAIDELPVLFTHALRSISLGAVFLLFNARPEPWKEIKGFFTNKSPALIFVTFNEFVIASIGLVLLLWALSLGPASVVIAVSSTRAFFLVIYSSTLALIWKGALGETTTVAALTTKAIATVVIVLGTAVLALSN